MQSHLKRKRSCHSPDVDSDVGTLLGELLHAVIGVNEITELTLDYVGARSYWILCTFYRAYHPDDSSAQTVGAFSSEDEAVKAALIHWDLYSDIAAEIANGCLLLKTWSVMSQNGNFTEYVRWVKSILDSVQRRILFLKLAEIARRKCYGNRPWITEVYLDQHRVDRPNPRPDCPLIVNQIATYTHCDSGTNLDWPYIERIVASADQPIS